MKQTLAIRKRAEVVADSLKTRFLIYLLAIISSACLPSTPPPPPPPPKIHHRNPQSPNLPPPSSFPRLSFLSITVATAISIPERKKEKKFPCESPKTNTYITSPMAEFVMRPFFFFSYTIFRSLAQGWGGGMVLCGISD